ncbi:MAG: hypothetical protein CYPHOPRED_003444 [Cyphobasidiales sp. Tagirdzhanova-0007]|nr:MAG: hypothetical protein CYPHOPRED_003444 [Cyphobasidiales sp. Tagirdzhanova-0007]
MLCKDTVDLSASLQADDQLLALITKRQGGSATHAWDGVMGIGPDALSFVGGNITPLSNLVKSGKLARPLAGILLVKENKITGARGGGEYRWGGINSAYVLGSIIYAPVTSSYFWGCDMSNVWVNHQDMFTSVDHGRAIIDTGTTLIYTSNPIAKNIHAQIPGSTFKSSEGAYYVPCDVSKSPNVFFTIQGYQWGVPASDIAFRASGNGDDLCVSGIQGGSPSYTILGDVFIKNHYIVLNYGNNKNFSLSIGFANRTDITPIL